MQPKKMTTPEITALLQAWFEGNEAALSTLIPLVYKDLHQAAAIILSDESAADTYQPTALVHAVYARLVSGKKLEFENRAHFFRHMALIMRRILIEHARAKLSQKRGSGKKAEGLEEHIHHIQIQQRDPGKLIDLDRALTELKSLDRYRHSLFELWFFAGLSADDLACIFAKSAVTIRRDLRTAKKWLAYELEKA